MIYNIGIIWPILSPQTGLRVQLVFSEAKVVCLIVSMKFVGCTKNCLQKYMFFFNFFVLSKKKFNFHLE